MGSDAKSFIDIETPPTNKSSPRKHYVLVVHGTFNGPKQGPGGEPLDLDSKWWAPRGSPRLAPGDSTQIAPGGLNRTGVPFCEKLSDSLGGSYLKGRGGVLGEAVWGDLSDPDIPEIVEPFFWGGKNSDASREEGAQKLAKRIMHIRERHPAALVHLIAHSHGGNVVLRAVEIILGELGEEGIREVFRGVKAPSCWRWLCSSSESLAKTRLEGFSESVKLGTPAEFWSRFGGELCQEKTPREQDTFIRQHYPSLSSANPLGRLVFLGTPFLSKKETPSRERTVALWWFLTLATTSIGINLLANWPASTLCKWGGGFSLVIAFCMAVFLDTSQGKIDPLKPFRPSAHLGGNIYHLTKQSWSEEMSALVVHAGILDEANFALRSTAPLVRAYVVPEVDHYFDLQPWKSLPADIRRATTLRYFLLPQTCCGYERRAPIFNVEIMIYSCIIAVLSFFLRLVLLPFVFIAKRVLIKGLQKVLVHVALGTGSAEKGVSGSDVSVSEHLKLDQMVELGPGAKPPEGKSMVVHWDVHQLILDKDTESIGTPSQKEPRFDFLSEPSRAAPAGEAGEARLNENDWLEGNSVLGALSRAGCFDGLGEKDTEELMLIAQMLEERQKEITGQVQVRHSLYYSKLEIIEAMVEFLQAGPGDELLAMLARFDNEKRT